MVLRGNKTQTDTKNIGSISLVHNSTKTLLVAGYFMIDPDYRSQGYGRNILEKVQENIYLDKVCVLTFAVPERIPFYQQFGLHYLHLDLTCFTLSCKAEKFQEKESRTIKDDVVIFQACKQDLQRLIDYDRTIYAMGSREKLLETLLQLDTFYFLQRESNICGYICLRQCIQREDNPVEQSTFKVMPFLSNSLDDAKMLLEYAINIMPVNSAFILLCPGKLSKETEELFSSFAARFDRTLAIMASRPEGFDDYIDFSRIFSISAEIG